MTTRCARLAFAGGGQPPTIRSAGRGCAFHRAAHSLTSRARLPQGLSESRVSSHNSHFGMRSLNKKDFSIFPFKFLSMGTIAEKHGVEYAKDA